MKVSVFYDGRAFQVLINDLPHIHICDFDDIVGFKSYCLGKNYCVIEFVMCGDIKITNIYDTQDKWEAVLREIGPFFQRQLKIGGDAAANTLSK